MKIFAKRVVCAMLGLALASNANAGTLVCAGTVTELSFHAAASVLVRLSGMNTAVFLCSVDTAWQVPGFVVPAAMSPSACKTVYASLLAAKASNTTVGAMYFDADGLPANCTSFAPWQQVNLRYFNLQ
ncbi:MAG: hypothetical protein ABIT83_08305 [Massilia sp.]